MKRVGKMSKYSKSSKRSQSGAGNHFDKLLKVCSNSKVAGSLGRFGVASFTSLRSTPTETPEEEKKPKSKYSSFKKRAKLDPSKTATNTSTSFNAIVPPVAPLTSSSLTSGPSMGMSPATTVYKPRKFFKSRGPMEVEVGANATPKPIRPEIGSLMPILPPSSMSPLIPTNTNTNTQYYADPARDHHPKKHKKTKKLASFSSPPPPTGSSSDSSFTSPPIKLRIFKDRGKFVAEAPSPVAPPETSPVKKRGRKPGSKNKKANVSDEFEAEEQKPPKQTKRARQVPSEPAPPPVRAASGRTTRNSTKQRSETTSEDGMPSLDRELRNSLDGAYSADACDMYQAPPPPQLMVNTCELPQSNDQSQRTEAPAQEIIKKLEEDADFKKLSEMLSSMESDSSIAANNANNSYNQQQSQSFNNLPYQQQQSNMESYPVNLTSAGSSGGTSAAPQGLSAFAAQAYMQQQFRQQMQQQQQEQTVIQQQHEQTVIQQQQEHSQDFYSNNLDIGYHSQPPQQTPAVQLPQQQTLPKATDIRSILVDDWTDFDDETHSPTGHNRSRPSSQASHHSQSPPKFSRFDMSAFMPSGSNKDHHHQQQQSPQFPPPEGDHIDPHHQQHFSADHQSHQQALQQQMPFNIHSSPYAMRNLLNCPQGQESHFQAQGQDMSQGSTQFSSCALESLQQHHHPAPLNSLSTCAKQEAISVLDSVLKQQELTDERVPSNPDLPPPPVAPKPQVAPSTRKASIFKSRAREQNQNGESAAVGVGSEQSNNTKVSKGRALYKHKFGGHDDSAMEEQRQQTSQSSSSVLSEFDEEEEEEDEKFMSNLRDVRIKNVKAVHQLQESGEFHEFDGDVQYILEDLRNKNPMNIRCLSAVTLASRCMEPPFRMHLRAHGTVAEFCRELHDCSQHPELALLAALVLFVLSQDRLNMDLDTDTLKLILALSKADDCNDPESQNSQENLETLRHRQKVLDLCVEMKNRGHATHLKLDRITASELALETLLHLTSKRAGEWVKHELRALGGLDSIVSEIESSLRFAQMELVQFGWTEGALERLRKVDRCLQVLQQVTFNHEHNQNYLLGRSERQIEDPDGGGNIIRQKCIETSPKIFVELFRFCKDNLLQLNMQLESAGVVREILFSVLRTLVNLSHDYRGIVLGSEILLAMDGFLQLCLHSTFEMGHFFPDEKIFDLLMHSLCMLLNLVEHSRPCRNAILSSTVQKGSTGNYRVPDSASIASDDSGVDEELPVLDAFVEMFLCRERAAKKEEQHTDNILTKGPGDPKSSSQSGENSGGNSQDKNSQDAEGSSLQDTIDKLIQTAGKHMENSLIAAYIALLLAYLIMDNPAAATQVRNSMPDGQYLPLMIFLKKLFNFMSITSSASGSIRGLKATAIALRFFAQADPKSNDELKRLIPD